MSDISTISEKGPPPRLRRAGEFLNTRKRFKPAAMLFDEFWREGELALMFGAAGTGKSVLAVQVGDALARGRPLAGFRMPTGRRRVLLVDLDLSDAQFEARYTHAEADGGPPLVYQPPESLFRGRPADAETAEGLTEWLRAVVAENRIQVVIIDSLSAIKNTLDGTRETLGLMRRLKCLAAELGISMLVVNEALYERRGGVSEADLGRSRVLCSLADSVFAIGFTGHRGSSRYVVQTRARSSALFWSERNAPVGNIEVLERGLLGFRFDDRFAAKPDEALRKLICRVRKLRSSGMTNDAAARELGISKSAASRLYRRWTPAMGCGGQSARESTADAAGSPGPAEDAALDNLRDESYPGEFTDNYLVRIGQRPAWNDRLSPEQGRDLLQKGPPGRDTDGGHPSNPVLSPEGLPHGQAAALRAALERSGTPAGLADLERRRDAYGCEMFVVSSEEPTGKPLDWYQFDEKANLFRYRRDLNGVFRKLIDDEEPEPDDDDDEAEINGP